MSHWTGSGNRSIGAKIPLNRNIGITSKPITMSKSCTLRTKLVRQIAMAEKHAAIITAAGQAASAQADSKSRRWVASPTASSTTRNAPAYSDPRDVAHNISPNATSDTRIGVARIPS